MQAFLRSPPYGGELWELWFPDAQGIWQYRPDCSLAKLHDFVQSVGALQTTLLIRGEQVFCCALDISQKQFRQGVAGIPFMIEELVSGDIDQFHVVHGQRNSTSGKVTILAVAKDTLSGLLEALMAASISPVAVLPDYLLVPEAGQNHYAVMADGHRVLLRINHEIGYVVDQSNLEVVLPLIGDVADLTPLSFAAALLPGLGGATTTPMSWSDMLASARVEDLIRHPLNLLQGSFRPKRYKRQSDQRWSVVAGLLAMAFFAQLLNDWGHALYYKRHAETLMKSVERQYQTLFPAETKIVNLRQQISSHLEAGRSGSGLTSLLLKIAQACKDSGELHPDRIEYAGHNNLVLDFSVEATRMTGLKTRLQQGGLTVDVSTVSPESGGVLQRLKISGEQ